MGNIVRDDPNQIRFDLDRDRLRDIVGQAHDFISEYLETSLNQSKESVLAQLETILETNRISLPFFFDFSSRRMNDLQLRVDPRRREVLGISKRFPTHKNHINSYLRSL